MVLVNIMARLTANVNGIIITDTGEPQVAAATEGHPPSITVNCKPNLLIIAPAASPRLLVNKFITKLIPKNLSQW